MRTSLFRTLYKRWKAESPHIFKNITRLCVVVGTLGAALIAMEGYTPSYVDAAAPHMLVAGIVGGVLGKITVKDTNKIL